MSHHGDEPSLCAGELQEPHAVDGALGGALGGGLGGGGVHGPVPVRPP